MDQTRFFGSIYLPEDIDNKIHGVWLTISDNSILLEASTTTFKEENWPILLGEFNGIDEITFINCYTSGGSSGAGGSFKRIYASYLIKGIHVNHLNQLKFNKMVLNSIALNNWITREENIELLDKGKYQIPAKKEIVNTIINNIKLIINIEYSTTYGFKELHAKRVCWIVLESENLIEIEQFSEVMRHLKKLILFLTNKNPEFDKYFISDSNSQYELINTLDSLNENQFTQNIQIQYHHIKDSLKDIICNWFEKKKLYTIIDLVLEKCYNTQMSPQGFFLNICVAMESFHSTFSDDKKQIPVSSNKDKIVKLLNEDENLLIWFKEKSKEWEKPTLMERLTYYKETIEFVMGSTFKFSSTELVTKIKRTRNEIAHTGVYNKHFNHIELFLISKIIEYTIKLEILKLFGVNIEDEKNSLLKNAKRNIETLARLNEYS